MAYILLRCLVSGGYMETKIERFEVKYLLNSDQLSHVKDEIMTKMNKDKYGATTIYSIYFDNQKYFFIKNSIEKPPFKEKIRYRRYLNTKNCSSFLEIKRKVDGYVFKRRLGISYDELKNLLITHKIDNLVDKQIANEVLFLDKYYGGVKPWIALLYEREAFVDPTDKYFRLTFDLNPRFRLDNLDDFDSDEGETILPKGWAIMEIKTQDSIPIWLSHILDKYKIYPTSFSKVGTAYKKIIERKNNYELVI